jgi:hypothetical protein
MKKQTKAKAVRIAELILVIFILGFVARATPNLNVIPNIPWADSRTKDGSGNTDDKDWGNYARMQFMATHPSTRTPTLKPRRPATRVSLIADSLERPLEYLPRRG